MECPDLSLPGVCDYLIAECVRLVPSQVKFRKSAKIKVPVVYQRIIALLILAQFNSLQSTF